MSGTLDKILDVLANLGFVMRDTRRDKLADAARAWGPAADGFVLSIHEVEPRPTLSVALKNTGTAERRAAVPGWFQYYRVAIDAPLSAFGQRLLSQETAAMEVTFPPGEPVATEIPLATLFDLRRGGEYAVSVSCRAPGSEQVLTSNTLQIRAKAV